MHINTKATNIKLTPEISEYLDKRLSSLEKLIDSEDESVMCDVEVGKSTMHHKSGEIFRAEINLHTSEQDYRAVSEKEDLYSAINSAKEEIMQSIRQHRSKIRTLLRRGSISIKKRIKGFKRPYTK